MVRIFIGYHLVIANHPRRKAPPNFPSRSSASIVDHRRPERSLASRSHRVDCITVLIRANPCNPSMQTAPFTRSRGAAAPPTLNSSWSRALNCTNANFFFLFALYPWTSRTSRNQLEWLERQADNQTDSNSWPAAHGAWPSANRPSPPEKAPSLVGFLSGDWE